MATGQVRIIGVDGLNDAKAASHLEAQLTRGRVDQVREFRAKVVDGFLTEMRIRVMLSHDTRRGAVDRP